MPSITGIAHVELSVRDLEASAAWYMRLLGLHRVFDSRDEERGLTACALLEPGSGLVLALMRHDANAGSGFDAPNRGAAVSDGKMRHDANAGSGFDPGRAGLDHLAFAVADRAELHAWQQRLDELGTDYTPLEEWSHGAAVTVRDPDGIALEFYVRGPAQS